MQYTAVNFEFTFAEDFAADILVAQLADIGFESFENTETGITAYCPTPQFDKNKLDSLLAAFPYAGAHVANILTIADQNWNEEWEKHFFQPIVIGNECVIHSSFHTDVPKTKYDIVINPKMAFGTGHHATTSLIIGALLEANVQGKSLLDMGCGTAVLAILASMRGANPITAIDIDNWCTENALENLTANHITNVDVHQGNAHLLQGGHFDIILANINRNILLMDMPTYTACLTTGGELYMSGFYTDDVPVIEAKANQLNCTLTLCREQDNWAMAKFVKG